MTVFSITSQQVIKYVCYYLIKMSIFTRNRNYNNGNKNVFFPFVKFDLSKNLIWRFWRFLPTSIGDKARRLPEHPAAKFTTVC